jgi:putative phage-type endonuclease
VTTPAPDLVLPELAGDTTADVELAGDPKQEQFLRERREIVGGTDAAAILGFHPWRTAWDVAAEKKGLLPPTIVSERMEWGTIMEHPIACEYAHRTGRRVRRLGGAVRDRDLPWLGGHPDRIVIGEKRGVEVKTVERGMDEWSRPGEPQRVPKHYYLQCQTYMSAMRFPVWDLVPLFGMTRMRIYEVPADERVIRPMRERLIEFHARFIAGPDMPPIEPSEAARAYLRQRFPEPRTEDWKYATEEEEEIVRRWLEAKRVHKQAEKELESWKMQLQQAIGDAHGIVAGEDVVSWKKDRDSVALETDWQGLLTEYASRHGFEVAADDIVARTHQVVTRTGARKLLVVRKGELR